MSATSPKPTSKSSEPTSDSVLGRRALRYEGVHAGAPFLVRKRGRDDARSERVGLLQAEVHLLVKGAFAGGEGLGRLFGNFYGQVQDCRVQSLGGNNPVDQAPFQRFLR